MGGRYIGVLNLFAVERLPGNLTQDVAVGLGKLSGVAASVLHRPPQDSLYTYANNSNFHTITTLQIDNVEDGLWLAFNIDRSTAIKLFCMSIIVTNCLHTTSS